MKVIKNKAFSLIELLIVVIVISILLSIAIPSYMKTLERIKAGKAKQTLQSIRSCQSWYRAHNDQYVDDITLLAEWGLPLNSILDDQDWLYTVPVSTANTLQILATRQAGPYVSESIAMDQEGHLTTTIPTGPWDVKDPTP